MIKAGALYFAIVIALVIAIISASLIMLASHYRNMYLKEIRFTRLQNNISTGIEISLLNKINMDTVELDLYGNGTDSVFIKKKSWGVFDLAVVSTYILQDTLQKAFLIGNLPDSLSVYLSDEDRPLSISGTTKIRGSVRLPKSGLRKSYVNGKSYSNSELIYDGKVLKSTRYLTALDTILIKKIKKRFTHTSSELPLLDRAEITQSFLDSTLSFRLKPRAILKNIKLKGNLVLYADSSVKVSSTSELEGVQIYAPYIQIEDGFKGNCQLFASDSISIGKNASLNYPSVAGVISSEKVERFPKITLAEHARFEGILFTYEAKRSALQTLVSLQRNSLVKGEVYAGLIKLDSGVRVEGKVTCNRFLMQSSHTIYENIII
ncbi:MAG: hypothetical protein EOO43_05100, partial [Flavobacterium sp.]